MRESTGGLGHRTGNKWSVNLQTACSTMRSHVASPQVKPMIFFYALLSIKFFKNIILFPVLSSSYQFDSVSCLSL